MSDAPLQQVHIADTVQQGILDIIIRQKRKKAEPKTVTAMVLTVQLAGLAVAGWWLGFIKPLRGADRKPHPTELMKQAEQPTEARAPVFNY